MIFTYDSAQRLAIPARRQKNMSSLKLLLVLSLFPTQGVSARVLLRGGPAREYS